VGALAELVETDVDLTVDEVREATSTTLRQLRHDRRVLAERHHGLVQLQAIELYKSTQTFRNFNLFTDPPNPAKVELVRQQFSGKPQVMPFEINDVRNDHEPLLHEMVDIAADRGGQFRWSRLPFRLHLYDDRIAMLSLDYDDTTAGAWVITHRGFIRQLIALHTRMWQAGQARPRRKSRRLDVELTAILRELVLGRPDEAAASRLGISLRSYRRRVSDLLDALGAPSRFAAGAAAERLGYLDLIEPPKPRSTPDNAQLLPSEPAPG
jgi:hypothetical protein